MNFEQRLLLKQSKMQFLICVMCDLRRFFFFQDSALRPLSG